MSEAETHQPPLTVAEAAVRLKMSKDTVRKLIERGLLTEIRYSKRLVYITWQSVVSFEQTGDPDWQSRGANDSGTSSGAKKVDRAGSQRERLTRR